MVSAIQEEYDPWDDVTLSPEETIKSYQEKENKDPWDDLDFDESFWKSALRTALQVPQGIAATTAGGLLAGLSHLIGTGEAFDPLEIERIKEISEREGIPFDEEAYMQAAQDATNYFPTVSNLGRIAEEQTGIPFEPKTRIQKGVRFLTEAGRLAPQPGTFRGMVTSLPRPVLGAGVAATSQLGQELGVPEPISDLLSFAILKQPPEGAPEIKLGTKTKPSGLPERQFESVTKPREVSEGKIAKINDKLEKDFRKISDKIIEESPLGETAKNLKDDPTFKQESRDLLNKAQEIADQIPTKVSSKDYKKELADLGAKTEKGFAPNEYDREYKKFLNESIKEIAEKEISAGQLVEQYRKNNEALGEYFEPGASKSLNRAKRDVILDKNQAIAKLMEKKFPESELVPVFKEGNARWTKIRDAEAVDEFLGELFSEKVNYKKMHDFFDKANYGRIFKRALGEKGFKEFEGLLKDMLTSEAPYKMLQVAKKKGFGDLVNTATAYLLSPKLGAAKTLFTASKESYKFLMNSLLDKPKLTFDLRKGFQEIKTGKFEKATQTFNKIEEESRFKKVAKNIIKEKKAKENLENSKEIKNLEKSQQKKQVSKKVENLEPESKEYELPKIETLAGKRDLQKEKIIYQEFLETKSEKFKTEKLKELKKRDLELKKDIIETKNGNHPEYDLDKLEELKKSNEMSIEAIQENLAIINRKSQKQNKLLAKSKK